MSAGQERRSLTDEDSDGSANRPFPNRRGNVDAFSNGIYDRVSFVLLCSICTPAGRMQHAECEPRQSMQKKHNPLSEFIRLETLGGYIREQLAEQDFELARRKKIVSRWEKAFQWRTWIVFEELRADCLWNQRWIELRGTPFGIWNVHWSNCSLGIDRSLPNVFVKRLRLVITPCKYCLFR